MPAGFTIEMQIEGTGKVGERLLDTRKDEAGPGVVLSVAKAGLAFEVSDGANSANLSTTKDCAAALAEDGQHQFAVVVDAGPSLITMVVDGRLCNGGNSTSYDAKGWAQYQPAVLGAVDAGAKVQVGPNFSGVIGSLRLYGTALRHTEVLGNQRADRAAAP